MSHTVANRKKISRCRQWSDTRTYLKQKQQQDLLECVHEEKMMRQCSNVEDACFIS